MDQEVTGDAGIPSAEAFGADGHPIQTLITGNAGIPSAEAFPQPTGVFIDLFTVGYSRWYSH